MGFSSIFSTKSQKRRSIKTNKKSMGDTITLEELLAKYYYKDDLIWLCEKADLHTKGVKDDLIERLLSDSDYTIKDYLKHLGLDGLKLACRDFDEYVTGTKDELIKRIIPHIQEIEDDIDEEADFDEDVQADVNHEKKIDDGRNRGKEIVVDFSINKICSIIENWTPNRRYQHEDGYKAELYSFLLSNYNFPVRQEAGQSRADILVDGSIAIEIKKNPNSESYDRMFSQLIRQKKEFGYAIGLIFDVKNRDAFQDFLDMVKEIHDICIIKK